MRKNFLKTALRYIVLNKGYSLINVLGLAVGMAVFILIILFVREEISYDRFHENSDNIFRIVAGEPDDKDSFSGTPAPLGPTLIDIIPEIEEYVRMSRTSGMLRYEDKLFFEKRFFIADPSFFKVFSFPLVKGDYTTVLEAPNSMIITESMAIKYFGSEDPTGKTVTFRDKPDYVITGIAKDVPENSHFHFDFIVQFENYLSPRSLENWGTWNYYNYLLLNDINSSEVIKEKIDKWVEENDPADYGFLNNMFYQPLTQIHFLYNRYNIEPSINGKYIKIFLAIAFIILTLACINFMNLSTARSIKRAKEVGIKKVIGAGKKDLIRQFIGESVLLTFVSFIISALFSYLVALITIGYQSLKAANINPVESLKYE